MNQYLDILSHRSDVALSATAVLAAVASLVGSAELLFLAGRGEFRAGGVWDWNVVSASIAPRAQWAGVIFARDFGVTGILLARVCAGVTVLVAHSESAAFVSAILLLCVCQLALNLRITWGDDGSDQMLSILLVSLAVAYCFPPTSGVRIIILSFIGIQSTLSYFCSGVAKLLGPVWRSGDALKLVTGHYAYGNRTLHEFLNQHPTVSRLGTYWVIAIQCTFPVYFLLPLHIAIYFILAVLMFHLGVGLVMRLNGFFFAFPAAYPALLYSHELISGLSKGVTLGR